MNKEINEKIDTMQTQIIGEYHDFIHTVERLNNEHYQKIMNEIAKTNENLNEYKAKVKHGSELFLEAVG